MTVNSTEAATAVCSHAGISKLVTITRLYYSAPKSQPSWLNLLHLPTLPPPVTARHRVVKFQEMNLNKAFEGITGCGGKDRENESFRREWKTAATEVAFYSGNYFIDPLNGLSLLCDCLAAIH